MKNERIHRRTWRLLVLCGLLLGAATPAWAISNVEVQAMLESGVPEPFVLQQIAASATPFQLNPADVATFKRVGATDNLLMAMWTRNQALGVAGPVPAAAAQPAPGPAPQPLPGMATPVAVAPAPAPAPIPRTVSAPAPMPAPAPAPMPAPAPAPMPAPVPAPMPAPVPAPMPAPAPAPMPAPAPLPAPGSSALLAPAPAPAAPAQPAGPSAEELERIRQEAEARARLEEARQAAEAERIRMEAARAGEDAKRQAAARSALAQNRDLQLGLELLGRGDHFGAIKVLSAFIATQNDPTSSAVYEAKFGAARAMYDAGLTYTSAGMLIEVLLLGAERPHFVEAFELMREVRKKINYAPPIIESFTKFYVNSFPQSFQDEFNYFLGEFFYDYNNFRKAEKYLSAVSDKDHQAPRAAYLNALIMVQDKKYKSAVNLFQDAVILAERASRDGDHPEAEEVLDLSYLALARIAYETGNYEGAVYYYRKIPHNSIRLSQALFEAGWTYFLQGNYRNALGVFHALNSPYLNYRYLPELYILEATAYLNLCHYRDARDAVAAFQDKYLSQVLPLKHFLETHPTPQQLYEGLMQAANGDPTADLPRPFVQAVLENVDFFNLYKSIKALEQEIDLLKVEGKQRLGEQGQTLLRKAEMQHQRLAIELGIKIQQILKTADAELTDLEVKATEVTFEIDSAEKDVLTEEVQKAYQQGIMEEKELSRDRGAASYLVGSQVQMWPFEGEFWEGELIYYKSFVQEACVQ